MDIIVKNHLRLKTQFQDDNPHGSYKAYLHPRGQNLELTELLKEEGTFNEQGLLAEQQFRYFPRTAGLAVILPIWEGWKVFEPNELGFSKTIDQAAEEIAKIPTYRNPDNIPAYVYTLDDKGNEIVPIWSSHMQSFAIRNMDGFLPPIALNQNTSILYAKRSPQPSNWFKHWT